MSFLIRGIFKKYNKVLFLGLYISIIIENLASIDNLNNLIASQQYRMISTYQKEYKVVLVGDEAVGKSSIIKRFIDETYEQILLKTIGVAFTHRIVDVSGKKAKLSLYDLSGQQKFHSIAPCIYHHSHALILCFDVTNSQSFENLRDYWFNELENHNRSECSIFIMGNKIDSLEHKVQREAVEQFAKNSNISKVYYVSAKQNMNIDESFKDLALRLSSSLKASNNHQKQKCKLTQQHQHALHQEGRCYKS